MAVPIPVSDRPSARLRLLLLLIAVTAIIGPLVIVLRAPHIVAHRHVKVVPQRVVPAAELPPVEPVAFQDLDLDEARAFNATIPFSTGPNPAARPFKFVGSDDQRARAIDCLAAAELYEAGDDPEGQRAVAQVVINRARHPAFPKTICGVVFQGSERTTGCQFSFTCDGNLAHRWPDDYWARARDLAKAVLNGLVYKPVGYSTHYHTDWVVPYWQSSLDKVAAVHTHLFFRWTGWWGTPAAFDRHVSPDEPVIDKLAMWSDAHKSAAALLAGDAPAAVDGAPTDVPIPGVVAVEPNSFLVTLDPKLPSDNFPLLAGRVCADRAYCKIMAWSSKAKTPAALPLQQGQIAAMSFSYLRDKAHNFDKALWNCTEFRRIDFSQCMKLQIFVPTTKQTDTFRLESLPGATRAPFAVAPLPGKMAAEVPGSVRKKAAPPPSTARPSTPEPVN